MGSEDSLDSAIDIKENMKFRVNLYSTLREILPREQQGRTELDLPDGCTIDDVVKHLELSGVFICAVNGQVERNMSRQILENDELRFFLPGSGG
jgi:sulfur carrier protein ThiS